MTKTIFRSIFLVAVAVLLSSLVLIIGVLYGYFTSVQKNQLKTELELAVQATENAGLEYLEAIDNDACRLTWIASDGSVLFDSYNDAENMENHAEREEVAEAFETGTGESSRYSSTLTEKTLYYAKLMSDGTVLRISVSHATVPMLVIGMLQPIVIVFAIALIISALLAHRLSKKIVLPLNSLDLDKPLDNNAYDEISPLLTHIDKQHLKIDAQINELKNRQNEFYAVIKNMNEGLVLLNGKGAVLSINPAAASFFSADDSCIGQDFLTIERNHEINKALNTAVSEGHSEIEMSRNGREFQLNISRIVDNEQTSGVVILIFDITDKVFAERNRREFTANVSHELKTPLHSIMGSAELIENGMVKPEDMPRFVSNIRSEAERLVTLINDIIRLSQLDESADMPIEEVDIYELALNVAESLSQIADSKNVTLTVNGEKALASGVRQLFREIIYNLCDNAIKYNVDGGSVKINVDKKDNCVSVIVSDTGIGIPLEQRERIFERFYRVDKSRSKETGGTGLGLSIVKHAVQYMGGEINLESTPGVGTTVTVVFKV